MVDLSIPDNWWQTYFGPRYMEFHAGRPYQDTNRELEFLHRVLGAPMSRRLLDACGGFGRHGIPLANAGWQVTIADYSEYLLHHAQQNTDPSAPISFLRCDIRKPFLSGGFSAAICMYTSLGYFADDRENFLALRHIYAALEDGGIFVLDLANRDFLVQHPNMVRNWWRRGQEFILEETVFNPVTSQAITENTLVSEGRPRKSKYAVRLYSLHEVRAALNQAGFVIEQAYGNYDGTRISMGSPRMLLVARK